MAPDIMTIDEVADYFRINWKIACRLPVDSDLLGFKVGGTGGFGAQILRTGSKAKPVRRWMEEDDRY